MDDYNKPKYLQVKNDIKRNIDDEVFKIGEPIPSERDLMSTYDVSRITIRRALDELEHEGYLYKVHGKGTYVKEEQNSQNLYSLTSCTQDIIRLGMTPTRKVLRCEVVRADKKRQNKLNLKEDELVFNLSRIYYADNDAINFTETYLPYKLVEGIEKYDFSQASLYQVIENKYNIKITKALRTVEAVIAYDDICHLMNIESGLPMLLFQCITYGLVKGKEIPIETFKCYYRSDKFTFSINQVR